MMIDSSTPTRSRPSGNGRLHLVAGYFQLVGLAGTVLAAGLIGGLIAPPPSLEQSLLHRTINLAVAVSATYGGFRTSWLLDRRRREGARHAVTFFALPLLAAATRLTSATAALLIPLIGLGLVATVWRYLE
jgi:hypothetical protein